MLPAPYPAGMSSEFRAALADALDAAPAPIPTIRHYRGIVIVAGGELYGRLAFHLIAVLRGLGCQLPVEVWHFAHEMPEPMRSVFADLPGVRLVDVDAFCQSHGIATRPTLRPGWWLKPFALRHCEFAYAMLLDADNVPAVNPEYLFNDTDCQKAGAMFWPDLPPNRERSQWVPDAAWHTVGLEPVATARPFESGQMIVDRTRHSRALDVAILLNEWSDVMYQVVYGDKDTFLLAWHLVGARYVMPPKNPVWRHPAICQHDRAGNLVFQHACQAKEAIARGDVIKAIVNRRFCPDAASEFNRQLAFHRAKQARPSVGPTG